MAKAYTSYAVLRCAALCCAAGDMRYCPAMLEDPALARFRGSDALYLDTTYCNPKYTFPSQARPPRSWQMPLRC